MGCQDMVRIAIGFLMLFFSAWLHAQDHPPRVEIGGVFSAAKQSDIGNFYHVGGGGRITVNALPYLAGEVEATRQPTGNEPFSGPEVHTAIVAKGTYRAEQHRWLKFAGLNFFGVVGPAFLNRSVTIANPNPPPFCLRCTAQRRQTASMLDFGGGFEIVPARPLAIRFDVTHAGFSEEVPFSSNRIDRGRTYLKLAAMFRMW